MLRFVQENARWLSAGFLLTFVSSFGQTWFISLFAGFIKQEHGLTDGSWGTLYTVGTLAAAALMFWRGSVVDRIALSRLVPAIAIGLALSALLMAFSPWVWLLGVALFGLRFCGQGMCSHIAMTAMGRWFEARRGQAVALANLGHPLGEVVLPLLAVLAIGLIGWRPTWIIVAVALVLVLAPSFWLLLTEGRTPKGVLQATASPGMGGRQWDRKDAARHWLLPALLPVLLTPGFVGTVVFFHQVHLADVKGWSLAAMAPGYSAFAIMTVVSSMFAGWAADRFGPQRLLPLFLIPMGIGIAVIGPGERVSTWYLALGIIGVTQGMASALWGVLLPHVYGTRYLGSIRSMTSTIMVVATALGPGVTGVLIDLGVGFPAQCVVMGGWCLCMSFACFFIQQRLTKELRPEVSSHDSAINR